MSLESAIFGFQFHKGTIKPKRLEFHPFRLITFNSIKVQLSPSSPCSLKRCQHSFNSIKVQLSHHGDHALCACYELSIP